MSLGNFLVHEFAIYRRTSSVQTSGEVLETLAVSTASACGLFVQGSQKWSFHEDGGGKAGQWSLYCGPEVDIREHDEVLWGGTYYHVVSVFRPWSVHHVEVVLDARR